MMQYIADYLVGVLQVFLIHLFIGLFLENKENAKPKIVVILIVQPLLLMAVNYLESPWLNILEIFAISFLMVMIVFYGSRKNRILATITVPIIFALCETVTMLIAAGILKDNMSNISENFITYMAVSISSCLLFFFVYWSIRMVIRRHKKQDLGFFFTANSGIFLLLIVSLLFAYYMLLIDEIVPDNTSYTILGFVLFILLIVVDTYMLIGNENERKKNNLERELAVFRYQEEYLTEMVKMQEENAEEMRVRAHEYKRHLLLMQDLISKNGSNETNEATAQYVQDALNDAVPKSEFSHVVNPAFRLLLDRTFKKCEESNIEFDTNIRYSSFSFMPFNDICILLGNALDNAVYACQNIDEGDVPKKILIKTNKQKSTVLIKISNTKTNKIFSSLEGIVSSKPYSNGNGIGIKNMERIADKYGGHIVLNYDKNEFTLVISISSTI